MKPIYHTFFGFLVTVIALLGVNPAHAGDFESLGEPEDPFNLIYRLEVDEVDDQVVVLDSSVEPVPEDALKALPRKEKRIEATEPGPPEKIHPLLKAWLAERSGGE